MKNLYCKFRFFRSCIFSIVGFNQLRAITFLLTLNKLSIIYYYYYYGSPPNASLNECKIINDQQVAEILSLSREKEL